MKHVHSEKNLQLMGLMHSPGIISTSSYSSIYSKIWNGIVSLSRDPCPDVALMGQKVVEHIRAMSHETFAMIPLGKEVICERLSGSTGSNSYSLPPSPNPKNFPQYMANSHSGSTARLNSESSASGKVDKTDKPHKLRVPIVKTNFVEWEISSMSRPLKYLENPKGQKNDQFASETMDRKTRFAKNARVRKEAADQQKLAVFHNLKQQIFIGKTSMTPSIVKLHPYEQQVVVAYLDRIMLHDWALNVSTSLSPMPLATSNFHHHSATIQTTTNSGKKMSVTSPPPSSLRVSSVQFVNAHDRSLILAGYDDGSVRIWKNSESNKLGNGNLVTAFQVKF